jgi:hypothetical protein
VRCANCEPIERSFRGYWLDGRPILPLRIRWAANYINCDNFPSEIPKISRIVCKVPTPAPETLASEGERDILGLLDIMDVPTISRLLSEIEDKFPRLRPASDASRLILTNSSRRTMTT